MTLILKYVSLFPIILETQMIGAIAGDMLGARFERYPIKTMDFTLIPSNSCLY
jgi:hypothetical protein